MIVACSYTTRRARYKVGTSRTFGKKGVLQKEVLCDLRRSFLTERTNRLFVEEKLSDGGEDSARSSRLQRSDFVEFGTEQRRRLLIEGWSIVRRAEHKCRAGSVQNTI